jgi:NTE family protein
VAHTGDVVGNALVLSGGGFVGVAWELGVVGGLRAGGVDPHRFDLIVGTSAGSIAGLTIASDAPYEAILQAGSDLALELAGFNERMDPELTGRIFARNPMAGNPDQGQRAEIGAMASLAAIGLEDRFVESFARFLPDAPWPLALAIAAVDVEDGAFATWRADSGVPLVRAVAASCAVPGIFPPVTIAGRRYMDGGIRSPTSVDVAAGHQVVVVISPVESTSTPHFDAETEAVRNAGGRLTDIRPNASPIVLGGPDATDPQRAFDAGFQQGTASAPELLSVLV